MTGPFTELPQFTSGCGYPLYYHFNEASEEKGEYIKFGEVYNLGPDVGSMDVIVDKRGFYYFCMFNESINK